MNYIKRDIEENFMKFQNKFPVMLLTGPRQVGKTTMLFELAKGQNRTYVSLDDLAIRSKAQADPAEFFRVYKPPIIIDEVQYAPNLFSQIKLLADRNKIPGEFWLTGSQQYTMMKNITESLCGRVCIMNLFSLTLDEIRGQINKPFTDFSIESAQEIAKKVAPITTREELFEIIYKGGMPLSVTETDDDVRKKYFETYINTYLMRDVYEYGNVSDLIRFHNFLVACSAFNGEQLNYSILAEAAEITQVTAKEWLKILQALNIIYLLQPYYSNPFKRLVKNPKLYFYDTGLCAYLAGWNSVSSLQNGAKNGAYFENFVVNQFVKKYDYNNVQKRIFYYRDFDQKEIDLVLEDAETLIPIEIKLGSRPDYELSSKFAVLEKFSKKVLPGAVVCTIESPSTIRGGTLVLPVSLI